MSLAMTASDGWTVARRNIFRMMRNPEVAIWSSIQPVMFIVLFVYVFGSIPTPADIPYEKYVMAGIFVQTVMFNSMLTGVGLPAETLRNTKSANRACTSEIRQPFIKYFGVLVKE